ncbi:methyltransferase, FkbM family [Dermatophilus congolensis]|uniref:Methyltransferase, FkbM family n=1 Tax=Dermatophilus congolensis TaxID=1863 RepID=A0A239VVV4_9MICO|nr:FkbM family methyltransferase [Dermatophilus congolensis]SNV25926.1 methyltransferase, FkbM family [Dermatophilus congolensis]
MSHNLAATKVSSGNIEATLIHIENDHIGRVFRETGEFYENDLLNIWSSIPFRDDYAFIDVGANLGNHSVYLGLSASHPIISIEPHEVNFLLLEENIKINKIENRVIAKNACAWDKEEMISLRIASEGNMGTVTAHAGVPLDQSKVPANKLDSLIEGAHAAAIKIDVEGNESRVLAGAQETISRDHPLIFIETHSPQDKREAISTLAKKGYSLIDFLGVSDTAFLAHPESPIEISELDLKSLTQSMRERRIEKSLHYIYEEIRQLSAGR